MDSTASNKPKDEDKSSSTSEPLNPDQEELHTLMSNLKDDPLGILSIDPDGVLRSLTADREVIDAIGLPTRLIKALLDRMPFDQALEDRLRGVDGTNVSREQMFHPDKSILPPPLSEEQKAEGKRFYEENKEKIEENRQKRKRGGMKKACAVKRSDYNLGPKEETMS